MTRDVDRQSDIQIWNDVPKWLLQSLFLLGQIIMKTTIVKEGTPVQAMGRYGAQTRYALGGNTVVLNAQGKLITVFSNANGTANGLGRGFLIPFK